MSSLTLQHASTNGGMIFLLCFLWVVIGFSFLILFLSKNKDFRNAISTFRRLPLLVQVIFAAFISGIIVFGSSKPGGTKSFNFNTWFPAGATDSTPSLSDAQKAAGFALVAVDTNKIFDFNAPTNAVIHKAWQKRGAAVDGFLLKPDDWNFTLWTNITDSVYVSSSGMLTFDGRRLTSPTGSEMPDSSDISFFAPLRTSLGIVPEANWHLLPGSAQSLFWHDITQRGSARFTWQNALLGRDAALPVSFQAELFNSGDFIFRYDFGTNSMPEHYVIGAQTRSGGETALASLPGFTCSPSNHICSTIWHLESTNMVSNPLCEAIGDSTRFELQWTAFGEITGLDSDGDGLTDAEEILLYHTNPHLADTDGDGISDGDEIALGFDPLNPDMDGDGIPDGIDDNPLVWNDPEEDLDGDGYGLLFELLHGLEPAVDDSIDTDGDGWEDWKEILAGTSPTSQHDSPSLGHEFPLIFSVTFTVVEPPGANVSLSVGDKTVVFPAGSNGSITMWLCEGIAHDVSLFAVEDCCTKIYVSISSACAAFQDRNDIFVGGGELRGGVNTSSGMIAQPVLSITPDPMCFHSKENIQVSASVLPKGMKGDWEWRTHIGWGGGNTCSISYTDFHEYVSFEFEPDGATQGLYASGNVTHCTLVEENPEWLEHDYEPKYPPSEIYPGEAWLGYDSSHNDSAGLLVTVNNDDDNGNESDDRYDIRMDVIDNDLREFFPLGFYPVNCCPCPEHRRRVADSAILMSSSSGLALWSDACKSNAFTSTVNAGEAIYIEGLYKSQSVGDKHLMWHYTDGEGSHTFTNTFTVLSQRIFGDLDFNGDVDSEDKALHPTLSSEYGWVIPVNTNAFRIAQLRTDIGLPGTYTLSLEGDP